MMLGYSMASCSDVDEELHNIRVALSCANYHRHFAFAARNIEACPGVQEKRRGASAPAVASGN